MIERRLDRSALHAPSMRRETFAQHFTPGIVSKKPEVRGAIYVRQPLAKRDEGSIVVRRDAQGVRERGEVPRRHEGRAVGGRKFAAIGDANVEAYVSQSQSLPPLGSTRRIA